MNKLGKDYYEARIDELRKRGFELNSELESLNLRLRDQPEGEEREKLRKRQQSVEEQLSSIQAKIKSLYDMKS